MSNFLCPHCQKRQEEGIPNHISKKDIVCGFTEDGKFNPKNWNCALLNILADQGETIDGCDQSATLISSSDEVGMIALSRYKHRGTVEQAIILDIEAGPTVELTLETALKFVKESYQKFR